MKTTESSLEVVNEETGEISPSTAQAEAVSRVQSSIVIAKKFPRNENQAFQSLMKACKRPSFADTVVYAFPRGGRTITGPSVSLAREAARVWGNIHYGLKVITDVEEDRTIRGWAWDVESNTYVESEDNFKKVIQRRQYDSAGNHTGTIDEVASERDLRELTNRRGAILVRNSLLQLLPKDLIDDAVEASKVTLKGEAKEDPEAFRKKLITAFGAINISVDDLEHFLNDKIDRAQGDQLTELRSIYKALTEGGAKWSDFTRQVEATAEVRIEDLTAVEEKPKDEVPTTINPERLKKSTGKVNEDQRKQLIKVALEYEWPSEDFSDLLEAHGASALPELQAKDFSLVQAELETRKVSPQQGELV